MNLSLLLKGISVATSVGLGCGSCCGSGAGILLSGYVMSHARDTRQSMRAFLSFFLGKVAGVAALCLVCSLVGTAVLGDGGVLSDVWAKRLVDLFMIGMGLYFLALWRREVRGKKSCGSSCPDHHEVRAALKDGIHAPALFAAGAGYGISPCAPLIIVTGLCVTLPAGYATITGAAFALASIASPLLIVLLLTGVLSSRIRQEIPGFVKWLRVACYLGMVAFFLADLATTI